MFTAQGGSVSGRLGRLGRLGRNVARAVLTSLGLNPRDVMGAG